MLKRSDPKGPPAGASVPWSIHVNTARPKNANAVVGVLIHATLDMEPSFRTTSQLQKVRTMAAQARVVAEAEDV